MTLVSRGTKGPRTGDDGGVSTELLMEGEELQLCNKFLQSDTKFTLWIIEYVWAHKMIDTLEDLDLSTCPEMDSQPLSLEDSLRLRVGSAQAYSIVRSRNSEHFETVMHFLETTHRLLPQLVSPIKHMKIMFGLKTMLIMRMLRRSRGLVDTMFKINQLFPSKLPQYQNQCSERQMFLMKKNHLDFKAFVQVLALEKDKLEDYIENQMEDEYGELYAQKVEERLLHYLLRLEAVLPGDTCVDKILKRGSPMTEEERTLLKVVTADSTIIVKTLKKLLHCDAVSSCPGGIAESSKSETESSVNAKSASHSSNSSSLLVSVEAKSGHPESDSGVLKESRLIKDPPQTEGGGGVMKRREENSESGKSGSSERSSEDVEKDASSPQFCSKHRRWVNNILQECPAECSEELQLQANVSSSPPLFRSSSGSSSDDLTPSNLHLLTSNQQPPSSHTSVHLQTSEPVGKLDSGRPASGSNTSKSEPLHQVTPQGDSLQPGVLFPVVRLIDIASLDEFCTIFHRQQASPNDSQQAASASSPQIITETSKDPTFNPSQTLDPENPLNSTHEVRSVIISHDKSTSTCSSTPQRFSSGVLKRSKPGFMSQTQGKVHHSARTTFRSSCPLLQAEPNVSVSPKQDASTSTSQLENLVTLCSDNRICFQHVVLQNPDPPPHPHPSIPSETSEVQRAQLKLSLRSQAMLLQSKLLQPCVSLVRLSRQERGAPTGDLEPVEPVEPVEQVSSGDHTEDRRVEEEEDADSSFDVNVLYSSSSDGENNDSLRSDPHYKPNIKRKRLLMEYEAARSMNNI